MNDGNIPYMCGLKSFRKDAFVFESVHSYESIPRHMNAVLKLVLIFAFDILTSV